MTNFVFLAGIIFGLIFVISPSEEIKIFPPSQGSTFVVAPGTARVEIPWTFNDKIGDLMFRDWVFVTTTELLAEIFNDWNVTKYNCSLPGFEIVKPATLVLKNVDDGYNGTYKFWALEWDEARIRYDADASYVSVFVQAKPSVTINCSSSITVNEGDYVRCLCKGEGGNPPAKVTWHKDGVQIDVAGYEKKMLTLTNIDKTASGTYECLARSYTEKDKKSIKIYVHQRAASSKSNGGAEWYFVIVSSLMGIAIGILLACIFVYFRRKFRNLRTLNSPYQDLDVSSRANSNGLYHSVRNESDASDGEYVIQGDSTYAQLNKQSRVVDENYQSLI